MERQKDDNQPAPRRGFKSLLRWLPLVVVAAEVVLVAGGVLTVRDAIIAFILVEGLLAVVLVAEAAALTRAYRRARAAGDNRFAATTTALRAVLPGPIATALVNELTIFRIIVLALRNHQDLARDAHPVPGGMPLPRGAIGVLLAGVIAVTVAILLLTSWPVVHVIALIVGTYAVLELVAIALSAWVLPHQVISDRLQLRSATWFRVDVPIELIVDSAVEERDGFHKPTGVADDELVVSASGRTNVVVELREPWTPGSPAGAEPVRRVRFHARHPQGAVRAIAANAHA